MARFTLGETNVEVAFKAIKHVHLTVHPPAGRVRVAAPDHMNLETVRAFAISKLSWIRQQQRKIQSQERETPRELLPRESHYVWGRRHLLQVQELDAPPLITTRPGKLRLQVRPGTSQETRQELLAQWYRDQVREAAQRLIPAWEKRLGVAAGRLFVQHMKTRWGSCNPAKGSIRLNTELAKKPRECLEYIVVHELAHLLEPTHNERFTALLDESLPQWRSLRNRLNRLPVRHEEWGY